MPYPTVNWKGAPHYVIAYRESNTEHPIIKEPAQNLKGSILQRIKRE